MGDRTLLEFQNAVSGALTRGTIDPTLLTKWVDDAYKELAYAFRFPEFEKDTTFPTVAGTYSYVLSSIATDYRMLHEEGLWRQAPSDRLGRLKKENRERWLRNIGDLTDTTQQAMPAYYHRYGKSIYFRPVPDGTVTTIRLHYWRKRVKLVSPTDVTELDADWDEIIELGALAKAYRYYREFDRAVNIHNDFLGQARSRAMEVDLEEIQQGGLNIAKSEEDLVSGG